MENKKYSKVNLASSNLLAERLDELRKIFPEAFIENQVDSKKLMEVLGDRADSMVEKFGFMWAGKGNAIKNVLIPSKATLKPAKDESVKFDESENIFIEGDNLEVLKLLQKAYFEKVKMIYIDPPYNTGGDFVYKDDFTAPLRGYLEQTGQVDGDGNKMQTNRETNGRYHSDWLSMMYPRLKLAWNFLRDDGVIFISIDDNEVHHLRMLMDEIFGEENFRNTISVSRVKKNIQEREAVKSLNQGVGYILCYSKSADALIVPATKFQKKEERWHAFDAPGIRLTMEYELFGQKPPAGRHWMYEKERALEMVKVGDLKLSTGANKPQYRLAASDETNLDTNWTDLIESDSTWVKNGGKNFKLIQRLLQVCNDKNGLILDFFAGSGTTAEAVLRQNDEDGGTRKFILVQLPEKIDSGDSNYDSKYKTIIEITKDRLHSLMNQYGNRLPSNTNGYKVFKFDKSNYLENNFDFDPEKSEEENKKAFLEYLNKARQVKLFEKTQEIDVVYENIIKEGLSLNAKIEKQRIAGVEVYKVADGEKQLLICLENKISLDALNEFRKVDYKGKIFICLDNALDDTTKANLALNVELKTI